MQKACTAAIYIVVSVVLASGQVGSNPDGYDKLNSDEYLGEFEVITRIYDEQIFTEGPAVDREGNVYFTNIRVSKILKWTLNNGQTSTHTQPEGVHPKTLYGGEGDGISAWAHAEYIMLIRNMLILEQEKSLWIAPCILQEWLSDNSRIEVRNASTTFGRVGFNLTPDWSNNTISVEMDFRGELPGKGFVLFADHPEGKSIKKVMVDGEDWQQFESNRVNISQVFRTVKVFF